MRDGRAVTSRFTEVSGDSMPSLFVHEAYTQISQQPAAGGSEGKQHGALALQGVLSTDVFGFDLPTLSAPFWASDRPWHTEVQVLLA